MPITNTIDQVRQMSGPVDKIAVLQRHDSPVLRSILRYAYDPMLKYGLKTVVWHGEGKATFEQKTSEIEHLLEKLSMGHGDSMLKHDTKRLIEQLQPEDAKLLKCIIRKDLRAGISVTTINKAFPGLINEFGVMRAKLYEPKRWRDDLMGSVKLDGLRCRVVHGKLYSRNGHIIKGVEHLEKQLKDFSDLDGEIMIPERNFQESSGALRSGELTPDAKLFLFDFTINAPFAERYKALLTMADKLGWALSLAKPGPINVLKHRTFESEAEMFSVFSRVISAGYEGLVLKTPDHFYAPKRSADWLKVKNVLSEDCPIVGFFEGEGKYENLLGGIIVERADGGLSRVGSGFTDAQRIHIWHNLDKYDGKMVEIQYHENTPDGDFRHARFKGFRPDKD